MRLVRNWIVTPLLFCLVALGAAAADADRLAELERRLAELEQKLAEALRPDADGGALDELRRQIQVLAEEIEDLRLERVATPARSEGRFGLGPAASKVYEVDQGVSLGGYGELLYENFDASREDGAPSGRTDQLDFLRAIVYFGYKFNDRIVFNSEIEFEHASTGRDGEVSVEFAYLDFLFRDAVNLRAGMVLVPMGFVNELHEPPVFLGARRPFVEQRLIPSTWRENGVGLFGERGNVSYRAYLIGGLAATEGTSSDASGFSASGIRNGRSSGSKSAVDDLAVVGRVDWQARPWFGIGASAYAGDAGQGIVTPAGDRLDAAVRIFDVHAEARGRGFFARTLFVRTTVDDVAAINAVQGFTGADSVGERQQGWYAEVGYDTFVRRQGRQALIPYLRYESYDTQRRVPTGFSADPVNDVTVTTAGLAYKPIPQVVVKADYSLIENEAMTGVDQLSVAVGFLY